MKVINSVQILEDDYLREPWLDDAAELDFSNAISSVFNFKRVMEDINLDSIPGSSSKSNFDSFPY